MSQPVYLSRLRNLHRDHHMSQHSDLQSRLLSHDTGECNLCRRPDLPWDNNLSGILHLPRHVDMPWIRDLYRDDHMSRYNHLFRCLYMPRIRDLRGHLHM